MSNKIPTPPLAKNIRDVDYKTSITTPTIEYVYGLKDISILDKQYERASVFISKPYHVDGNVMQVGLSSVEEHPTFHTDDYTQARQTSIEYYITHTLNPTSEQWYSVLPEGQKDIVNEFLLFDDKKMAYLRFPCNTRKAMSVYRDGVLLEEDDWSFILSDGGNPVINIIRDFNSHACYTIDYFPDESIRNPWTVDFQMLGAKPSKYLNKDGAIGQIFPGADHNGMVELEYYPYIDYSTIYNTESFDPNLSEYSPIQVTLENANIIAPGKKVHKRIGPLTGDMEEGIAYTKNITDYLNPNKEYVLSPYDAVEYPIFEYYQSGRHVYFSETFNKSQIVANNGISHGNANISIQYEYLASNIRLKIILRRIDSSSQGITPVVHQYSLQFRMMK